jgi:hypothetical protein
MRVRTGSLREFGWCSMRILVILRTVSVIPLCIWNFCWLYLFTLWQFFLIWTFSRHENKITPCPLPQPHVSAASESEVIAPVMLIMPELQELWGKSVRPLSIGHLEVDSIGSRSSKEIGHLLSENDTGDKTKKAWRAKVKKSGTTRKSSATPWWMISSCRVVVSGSLLLRF